MQNMLVESLLWNVLGAGNGALEGADFAFRAVLGIASWVGMTMKMVSRAGCCTNFPRGHLGQVGVVGGVGGLWDGG